MTKRQEQWMEVGMAFEEDPRSCDGLCHQLHGATGSYRYFGIIRRLLPNDERRFKGSEYWLNFETTDQLIRATFAYLMAAMTDSERDAIVEGL